MQCAQELKLSVKGDVCKDITNVVSNRRPDEEVEVRFGYLANNKYVSGIGPLTPATRLKWYTIINILRNDNTYTMLPIEKTLSQTHNFIRKITDLGSNIPDLFQEKKRISVHEITTLKIGEVFTAIRLNRAIERTLSPPSEFNPDNTRIRTRVSFISRDSSHRIDLTYVTGSNGETVAYEMEIEYLTTTTLPQLFVPVKYVLALLKGTSTIIPVEDYKFALNVYNNMFTKEARFDPTKLYRKSLPQPVNLKRRFIDKLKTYAVTNKLNGVRMAAVIHEGVIYGISMTSNIIKLVTGAPKSLNGTLIDGEYFQDVFYGFDVLFVSGSDIRNKSLDTRLKELSGIVDKVNQSKLFTMKEFRMSGDILQDTKDMLAINAKLPEDDNDGLIFSPINLPYFNNAIYKWKPPHMLTIDFMATKIRNGVYVLETGSKAGLVKFSPNGFNGIVESSADISGIGEYSWDFENKTFKYVRSRSDKTEPNFLTTAQDVWEDISHPITEKNLLNLIQNDQSGKDAVRDYHNAIKRELIDTYAKNKTVIDLGAGKGGDLAKYHAAGVKVLYAVEPNKSFLEELKTRANKMQLANAMNYDLVSINTRAQDTKGILEKMSKRVEVASMFFSLSFFFENLENLNLLIDTLDQTLEKGGLFIGTTIDGKQVMELLKDKQEITVGPVTIKKRYSEDGTIGHGKAIDYVYKESATVSGTQREYLVDWTLFEKMLSDKGFDIMHSEIFSGKPYLTEEENVVTTLNRSFVIMKHTEERAKDLANFAQKVLEAKKYKEAEIVAVINTNNPRSIAVGANTELFTPLSEITGMKFYRIGVIGDGNCFFHAIYTAVSESYNAASRDEKMRIVSVSRRDINVSFEDWMDMYDGKFGRNGDNGFDNILVNKLLSVDAISDGKTNLLHDVLGVNGMKYFIDNIRNRLYQNKSLKEYMLIIVNVLKEALQPNPSYPSNKTPAQKEEAVAQFSEIIKYALNRAFTIYQRTINTDGTWVGQEVLNIVGKYVDKDIYIINTDGIPYKTECAHTTGRESVILYYQGGNHYETVGVKVDDKIVTEFDHDSTVINVIRTMVC